MNLKKTFKRILGLKLTLLFVVSGWSQSFSNSLSYPVQIINLKSLVYCGEVSEEAGSPYRNHIMIQDRMQFMWNLVSDAGTENKPVYGPKSHRLMTESEVRQCYIHYETVKLQHPYPPYDEYETMTISPQELWKDVHSIECNEQWSYDEVGGFNKKVLAFGPRLNVYDLKTGVEKGDLLMFWNRGDYKNFSAQSITQLIQYRVYVAPVNDTTFKYHTVTMKEVELMKWFDQLTALVLTGKLDAYDPYLPSVKLGMDEINYLLFGYDTGRVTRPHPPYEKIDTVVKRFDKKDIKAIDFFESWSFDNNGNLVKEILAYQPVELDIDFTGTIRGFNPLFFICTSEKSRKRLKELNFFHQQI